MMPDGLLIAIGCLAGLTVLPGVIWRSVRPSKRGMSSYLAPRSGVADEPGKYNEHTLLGL